MKIGIYGRRSSDDLYYRNLKSYGFDYFDFSMVNTNIEPYAYDEKDFVNI